MAAAKEFRLQATQLGKRYNRDWVFRSVDAEWRSGEVVGISGANGSGKSTFLKVISGFLRPTRGKTLWYSDGHEIDHSLIHQHVSLAAPYVSLIEELKLHEFLKFHFSFRDHLDGWSNDRIIERLGFTKGSARTMDEYSSGMKQRVRLATALLTDSSFVLLDEPTTNLDEEGKNWFQKLLEETRSGRLIFIASNEKNDFRQCSAQLDIMEHKQ